MPPSTPFLRRRVLDGLPVDRLNGLWTRGFNEYYKNYIATNSMRPLLHVIGLYSITGYTMSHAVKHSQTHRSTHCALRRAVNTQLPFAACQAGACLLAAVAISCYTLCCALCARS